MRGRGLASPAPRPRGARRDGALPWRREWAAPPLPAPRAARLPTPPGVAGPPAGACQAGRRGGGPGAAKMVGAAGGERRGAEGRAGSAGVCPLAAPSRG